MNNQDIERLINIEAGKLVHRDEFLLGAHYVLNNFMPKWVRVEDGLPERENKGSNSSVACLAFYSNGWTMAYYHYTLRQWYILGTVFSIRPTHWYIPQPPNE